METFQKRRRVDEVAAGKDIGPACMRFSVVIITFTMTSHRFIRRHGDGFPIIGVPEAVNRWYLIDVLV